MREELHRPTIRVLEILECLADKKEGITLTELSSITGYSKSTIFPIIKTLVDYNYAKSDDSLRYTLGFRACVLASAFTNSSQWLNLIHQEMQHIVDNCDEVCQLGVLDGDHVLYIDKVQSKRTVQLISYIGKRLPAEKTALGKTLIAGLPETEILKIFSNNQKNININKLLNAVRFVKEHGYAIDDREVNEETKCYAVALCQHNNPVAALSVSLPFFRDTPQTNQRILQQLFETKKQIETAFNAYTATIELVSK